MPNPNEQAPISEEQLDISSTAEVHPMIAALEKADAPMVVMEGFLGTSKDANVRLYEALDVSSYLEIPREAIIQMEADKHGEPGAVRAFVRASHEILSVQRSWVRAGDYTRIVPPEFPTRARTCAGHCEEAFKPRVTAYFIALTRALREQNPVRQAVLLERAAQLKAQAKASLYECLSQCARRNSLNVFGGLGAAYQAILVRNHMDDPE